MEHRMVNRLKKDLENMQKNYSSQFVVELPNNDLKVWHIHFPGGSGTIYENEQFLLQFKFPPEYPIEAPEVLFLGKPPDHEHIYSNGFICLSVLYDGWSAAMSVASICLSIQSMLASAKQKEKPANDQDLCKRSKGKSPKDFIW